MTADPIDTLLVSVTVPLTVVGLIVPLNAPVIVDPTPALPTPAVLKDVDQVILDPETVIGPDELIGALLFRHVKL